MRRAFAMVGVGVAIVAPALVSCFGAADYRCMSDDDCLWNDRRGTCEATQYCSYPHPDCPWGMYSDQAGDLAGRCVDDPTADGTASSSGSTTGAIEPTTGADTSTGSIPVVCGNGRTEPGEMCDDGNEVDGDGCNVDCVLSGAPRWDPPERVHTGAPDADARFEDVDVRPDESFIAVGLEAVIDEDALFVLYDGDGEVVWARQYDRGMGDDVASSVTTAVGSEIWATGRSPNVIEPHGWIGRIEPADGDVEASAWTGQGNAVSIAYMHASVLVVGGHGSGLVGARAFSEILGPLWTAEQMISSSTIVAVAADGVRDVAYAAGNFGGFARVVQLAPGQPEPLVTLFDGPESSAAQGLAFRDGALAVGGYVGVGMRDGWVQRLGPAGTPQWTWSSAEPGEDEVEDVAIAPTGHVVAVGFGTQAAKDARVWKLEPDGALAWTWTWDAPLPNDDVARAVAIMADGDIVVAGGRTAIDGAEDAWVVRLTP